MGLGRRAAALAQVAGRAGRRHIFPCRAAAKRARDDVIEGEVVVRSAILAAEAVAKEEVEPGEGRSEEHTSELQSLMRRSYAAFCLKKTKQHRLRLQPTESSTIKHNTQ